ncbi:MAG TPA: hypothetical protein VEX60_18440 [Pyrinomonadaceae bacterium]|nr:hypothetical protein [Pyrinomonadaceae bacterium]
MQRLLVISLLACSAFAAAHAQGSRKGSAGGDEFGPIVRSYLDYLRVQQDVVDDRVSRREVDRRYYLHNSNRIRALRQMAIQIARESENDYLPELEAVSQGELDQLFDTPPPKPSALKVGELLEYKFRFLGVVVSGREKFYLFARLDPYEQAELRQKAKAQTGAQTGGHAATSQPAANAAGTRPRRVNIP